MANLLDTKIANLGAGFTIGFGIWTTWTATKQTMAHRRPTRSIYIWMVWGEILSNLLIAILAWLYLDGVVKPGVPVFFFITFLWVFEVQLLMQIIINRVAVVVGDRSLIRRIKWTTAVVLTLINISVFIVWIPAQLEPPPIPVMVEINKYFDRITKGVILLIDASLNLYFLTSVKKHLIKEHGLVRYQPLVRFNARLMAVSISMDVMLIILESLPEHGLIWEQFHPVAYMVKLNIEMTMAALIAKIASGSFNTMNEAWYQGERNPPGYSNDSSPDALQSSAGSKEDAMGMDLSQWPTVLNGTTATCSSANARQFGDISHLKPSPQTGHATTADPGPAHPGAANDCEIRIAADKSDARLAAPAPDNREPERRRFGMGAIGRTLGRVPHANSSEGTLGPAAAPAATVHDAPDDDGGAIVRTREVEVRFDKAQRRPRRPRRKKGQPSRIGPDGDYIGRPRRASGGKA